MNTNRVFWIIVFLSGSVYITAPAVSTDSQNILGWFLLTSLWSAFCGIGFSLIDWLTNFKN